MTQNAFEIVGQDYTFEAGADLSTKQYYAVKLDSNGQVVVAGAGEAAIGILQNKPAAAGRAAQVRVSGVSHWVAGGAIAGASRVAPHGDGKAQVAVAASGDTQAGAAADTVVGSFVLGRILGTAAAASGDWAPVLITHEGAVPTTAA